MSGDWKSWNKPRKLHAYEVLRVGRDAWEPIEHKDIVVSIKSHGVKRVQDGEVVTSSYGNQYRMVGHPSS